MWLFGCLVFVIAALIEYAVLIKIRYGNASVGLVRERVMRKKKSSEVNNASIANCACEGVKGH